MTVYRIGDNTGDDFSGSMHSGYLDAAAPTATAADYDLEVGLIPASEKGFTFIADCTGLPAGTITAAKLVLKQYTNDSGSVADIRRLLVTFVQSQCCWDNRSSGNAWNTGGAKGNGTDRNSTVVATLSAGTDGTYIESSDLAAVITDMRDNPGTNYGFVIHSDGVSGSSFKRIGFLGVGAADGSKPYIEVDIAGGSSIAAIASYYRMLRANN
jgi:hypothetical protein